MLEKANKRKFALWVHESTLEEVRKWYGQDNCSCQSEFIEKAILFYTGYLSSGKNTDYLSKVIVSTLKGIVAESDNKVNRMLFKLAVELAVTMNVVAATSDIDKEDIERIRGACVNEVKRMNGSFTFNTAHDWQE